MYPTAIPVGVLLQYATVLPPGSRLSFLGTRIEAWSAADSLFELHSVNCKGIIEQGASRTFADTAQSGTYCGECKTALKKDLYDLTYKDVNVITKRYFVIFTVFYYLPFSFFLPSNLSSAICLVSSSARSSEGDHKSAM
jgi:hypothetical protein